MREKLAKRMERKERSEMRKRYPLVASTNEE